MKNLRRYTGYTLMAYLVLFLLDGLIRVKVFLNLMPEGDRLIPAVSNSFAIIISTAFIGVSIITTSISTYLYIYIVNFKTELNTLFEAWQNLILVDILFELVKISLSFILFLPELKNMNIHSNNFTDELGNLPYIVLCRNIDQTTIYLSVIVFTLTVYRHQKKQIVHSAFLGCFLLMMMLGLQYIHF